MQSVTHHCRKCGRRINIPAKVGGYACKCGNVINVSNRPNLNDLVLARGPSAPEVLPICVGRATIEKKILDHAATLNPAYSDELSSEDWAKLLEEGKQDG